MIRSLHVLEHETQWRAGEWLRRCGAKGVAVLVIETRRTSERQAELYAIGRSTPGKIVTNARPWDSIHQYDRALDAVPWEFAVRHGVDTRPTIVKSLDWTPFRIPSDETRFEHALERDGIEGALRWLDGRWRVMVEQAITIGLEWSGTWKTFREFVHFQFMAGATLDELRTARGIEREGET